MRTTYRAAPDTQSTVLAALNITTQLRGTNSPSTGALVRYRVTWSWHIHWWCGIPSCCCSSWTSLGSVSPRPLRTSSWSHRTPRTAGRTLDFSSGRHPWRHLGGKKNKKTKTDTHSWGKMWEYANCRPFPHGSHFPQTSRSGSVLTSHIQVIYLHVSVNMNALFM